MAAVWRDTKIPLARSRARAPRRESIYISDLFALLRAPQRNHTESPQRNGPSRGPLSNTVTSARPPEVAV